MLLSALLLSSCGSSVEPVSGPPRATDVTLAVVAGPPPVPAEPSESVAPWPMASRDARHSGQASVDGPTTGRLRWIRQLEGNVTPGPVVGADGTVYLASHAGILHALDGRTGADRWTLDAGSTSGGDLSSSPVVLDSGVVVWPAGSSLLGVSPAGEELWRLDLGSNLISPVPVGDRVYVQAMGGTLYAMDLAEADATATVAWSLELGSTSYAGVAIGSDGAILTNVGNDVVSVRDEGTRGTETWRVDLGVLSEISPAVGPDGTIVSGGNDRWIQTFTPDGEPIRRFDRETESFSSPIVTDDGVVVQGSHRAAVVAVDLVAGEHRLRVRRRVKQPGRGTGVWTAPVLDRAANVYFGTRSGRIVGFSWTGELLFDLDAGVDATIDSYPAITGDGALIVGDTNGVVRAIADDGALPPDAAPD